MPSEVNHAELDDAERLVVKFLWPASAQAIAASLETLRARYGEWSRPSPAVMDVINQEWLMDLQPVPAVLLAEACRLWRTAEAPPNKRPPQSAGELIAPVRPAWSRAKFYGQQIVKARETLNAPHRKHGAV